MNNLTFLHPPAGSYVYLVNNRINMEERMNRAFVYIDNSNVFIEGCRVSAVKNRLDGADNIYGAMNNKITDFDWRMGYIALHELIARLIKIPNFSLKLWGSPPPDDPFWDYIRDKGFEVTTYERNRSGKEKKAGNAITYQIAKDAFKGIINKDGDVIFLLAGDNDYSPEVSDLKDEGFSVNVIFWDHAAIELKSVAAKFISLDPYFDELTL
jgi:hypothetical protein